VRPGGPAEAADSNAQARCTLCQAQGKADHATAGARAAHYARGPDNRRAGGAGAVQHPDGRAASRVRCRGLHTGLHPAACIPFAVYSPCIPYTAYTPAYRWVEYFDPQRNLPSSSMVVKCPPWQRLRSSGRARRLLVARTSQGGSGHWAPQLLPRVLEPVASEAADSTAFDHPTARGALALGHSGQWSAGLQSSARAA